MSPPQLKNLWRGITNADVYTQRFGKSDALRLGMKSLFAKSAVTTIKEFLQKQQSIYDTKPLTATLKTRLAEYYDAFRGSQTSCAIAVSNLTQNRREILYKIPSGTSLPSTVNTGGTGNTWSEIKGLDMLVQVLVGSAALPILFPIHVSYSDGGIM